MDKDTELIEESYAEIYNTIRNLSIVERVSPLTIVDRIKGHIESNNRLHTIHLN